MSAITAFFFYIGVFIFGILPFPLLYVFSDVFRFFLHKVFRYRLSVVRENLSKAFPEMDRKNLRKLERDFYKNLSDIFLEGVKAFSMTKKQIIRRHKIVNPEILSPYFNKGQDVLGVTGHLANWEWGSLSASTQLDANIVAFYKKLNNKYIDGFVRRSRMKFGTTLASIEFTANTFEKHAGKKVVFLMAADQNTIKRNLKISRWISFFGREVPFLHGPEKYATQYNMPVVFIEIRRIRRGFYEINLYVIAEKPRTLPEGYLTRLYAERLEQTIRNKPEDWLWSHKRWKFVGKNK